MSKIVYRQIKEFFPAAEMSLKEVEDALADGHILVEKEDILRYVQAALLDEKVLEIRHDGLPTKYFTRLADWVPPKDEVKESSDKEAAVETADGGEEQKNYKEGDYLLEMTHLFSFPVEPDIGNIQLQDSTSICIKMSISGFALEFGTTFLQQETVGANPVLKLAFPSIARMIRSSKVYRAKVTESVAFTAVLKVGKKKIPAVPVNISVKGITVAIEKEQNELFIEGDTVNICFFLEEKEVGSVSSFFRQSMKIRNERGLQHLCELEFHLCNLAETSVVESLVAKVQRVHLKELAEKSDVFGVNLVM